MDTGHRSENLGQGEMLVSGGIVEAGTERLVIREIGTGRDVEARIDDRTKFVWSNKQDEGRLTNNGQVRVGFYIAGGLHIAGEVLVLDPGNGESIAEQLVPTVH